MTSSHKERRAPFSIFYVLRVTGRQQYTDNELLRIHCNSGCANASQCRLINISAAVLFMLTVVVTVLRKLKLTETLTCAC